MIKNANHCLLERLVLISLECHIVVTEIYDVNNII